jgi:outer membrane protein assembly factor BamB
MSATRGLLGVGLSLLACGSRTTLEVADGVDGGAPANPQPVAGRPAGGSAPAGGSSPRGGTSAGGAGTGGHSGQATAGRAPDDPDFVFDIEPDQAVTYMIDPAHDGAQPTSQLIPPLRQLWSVPFDGAVSYPLLIGSRVFVTAWGDPRSAEDDAPKVYALDAESGKTLWQSPSLHYDGIASSVQLAYDRGRVFACNEDTVAAFDAVSGQLAWHLQFSDINARRGVPVAAGGALFLTGSTVDDYNLFVLRQRDGAILFRAPFDGVGSPTLGDQLLYSTGNCNDTLAFDARTGDEIWHHRDGCYGSGERSVLHAGTVFVQKLPEGIAGLDASTGMLKLEIDGTAGAPWPPAAIENTLLLASDELRAYAASTGQTQWSVPLEGGAVLPVLVTRGVAFVLIGGQLERSYLVAVDLSTRQVIWRSPDTAFPIDDYVTNGIEGPQAMAAGSDRLVVPRHRFLTAFASAFP